MIKNYKAFIYLYIFMFSKTILASSSASFLISQTAFNNYDFTQVLYEFSTNINEDYKNDYLDELISASEYANSKDLLVNVGHGLNYENLTEICKLKHINEINIGHAIISQAVFTGLGDAIKKIISIINNCD